MPRIAPAVPIPLALLLRLLLLLSIAPLPVGCVSSFIYFPDREISAPPPELGLSPEWVFFTAPDGVRLSAWYVAGEKPRGLILFFHGNGGNISDYSDSLALFRDLGYASLAVDYHGYGRSGGVPSETATYLDAEAAWQYAVGPLQFAPRDVIVWGFSLGGAIAAWLARAHDPGMLVLQSAFTRLRDAAAHLYPWAPTKLLVGDRYSTETFLDDVRCPVLVIHSPDDETIPYALGQRLFDRAKPPKRFLQIRGGHDTGDLRAVIGEPLDYRMWRPAQ